MPPRSRDHAALGRAFRAAREREGLTQEQLAKRSGLQATYVSDIERGVRNPTYEALNVLAKALGIRLSEIIHNAES